MVAGYLTAAAKVRLWLSVLLGLTVAELVWSAVAAIAVRSVGSRHDRSRYSGAEFIVRQPGDSAAGWTAIRRLPRHHDRTSGPAATNRAVGRLG
jgi:hypothetical protein